MQGYKGIKKVVGMSKRIVEGTYIEVIGSETGEVRGIVRAGFGGETHLMADGWFEVGYLTRPVTMEALRVAVDVARMEYEEEKGGVMV